MDMLFCTRNAFQRVPERDTFPQRAFGGPLNRFAISDWITEGNTELDDVCPGRGEFDEQKLSRRKIGITRSDEGNKAAASSAFKRSERLPDSAHRLCKSATSWTSLSPRPDRFTIIASSAGNSRATRTAGKIACEVSSAGMIPSRLAHSSNPSSASTSVDLMYSARPVSCK